MVDVTAGSVPKKVSDADRKRIADLEKSEAIMKDEVSKLKVRHATLVCHNFKFLNVLCGMTLSRRQLLLCHEI